MIILIPEEKPTAISVVKNQSLKLTSPSCVMPRWAGKLRLCASGGLRSLKVLLGPRGRTPGGEVPHGGVGGPSSVSDTARLYIYCTHHHFLFPIKSIEKLTLRRDLTGITDVFQGISPPWLCVGYPETYAHPQCPQKLSSLPETQERTQKSLCNQ